MSYLDLAFSFFPLLIVLVAGTCAHRHLKSVADFMSGGRCAGRYLLAIAGGELQAGAVVFVYWFEIISHTGFTYAWWNWLSAPVFLVVGISGFVKYRFRETRALTLAQFFEIRYDKSFRLFTGVLAFFAGILNFGVIPVIGARCLVYFLSLPPALVFFSYPVPTYIPLMAIFLMADLFVVLSGGMITILLINCIEGIMSQLIYLILIAALLLMFSWPQISSVLEAQPPGHSMLNPFDSLGIEDFNLGYVLMGLFVTVYSTMAWQNSSAYNSAPLSAHESRMGAILGNWREVGKGAVVTLLGICAFTYLHHPDFASGAAQVRETIHQIPNAQIQEQMESPAALAHLLPIGIKGLFCAVLLMGVFGGDATHLHSWGSIFVQDVIVPRLKKPMRPTQHIWCLRISIIGVALFAFCFGIFFTQTDYIAMWWNITQAIFTGGAGAAIIGGLYWKKGTATGAWAAVITGSVLSVGGILVKQVFGHAFPLNLQQVSFLSTLISIAVYVFVSLASHRKDFDLNAMLHRTTSTPSNPKVTAYRPSWAARIIGIDEHFTLSDKWMAGTLLGWGLFFFAVLVVGTIWNLLAPWPLPVWSTFWHIVGIGLPVVIAVITGLWFTWGGIRDIRALFRRLRVERVNERDDGTVVNHHNLDEAPPR